MSSSNKKKFVLVRFPHCGLGNKLVVWSRAVLFARMHNLPLIVLPWWGLHLGAIVRNERKKRFYVNMLEHTNLVKGVIADIRAKYSKASYNPALELNDDNKQSTAYIFDKYNLDDDIFSYIRNHGELIKEELHKILTKEVADKLKSTSRPEIGVHVRRGDFTASGLYTPMSFFVNAINSVRQSLGREVPVTVFTDGRPEELEELLKLPGVALAENNSEIIDILRLSYSKVLILSRKSSFSYWAAYLSDAVVIKHTEEWQKQIKYNVASGYTEIFMDEKEPEKFRKLLGNALQGANIV